jgi:hypothetical protein
VSLVAILLPLKISQEQGVRKETKGNGGLETEHQGRSGSNMLQRVMQNFQKRLGEYLTRNTTLQTLYSGSKYCN